MIFQAAARDWLYYGEQVRRAKFAIDEAQLKTLFRSGPGAGRWRFLDRLPTVLASVFVERFDIPLYHPDVRVWEIFDANGEGMALFLRRLFLA